MTDFTLSEKFRLWMDRETDYAVTKFPMTGNLMHIREFGPSGGDFSFVGSITRYLMEARQKRQALDVLIETERESTPLHRGVGLMLARALGKAAHNSLTLATFSEADKKSIDPWEAYRLCRDETTFSLGPNTNDMLSAIDGEIETLGSEMDELQQQYLVNYPAFWEKLGKHRRITSELFINACLQHGWPTPGVSSSDDVTPWVVIKTTS